MTPLTRMIRDCLILCWLAAWCPFTSHATPARPNFVIINIDDLGYGDIGPFGNKTQPTPHLDRMAEEGRKLTSFYAAPVCSPSRSSLMTGCYPKRVLPIPHVLFPAYDHGLSPDEVTVAELLKECGYKTGMVGKWHLGDQAEFLPTRQGFDTWYGLPYSNDMGPAEDGVKSNLGDPLPKANPKRQGQPPLPLMRQEKVVRRVLPKDQRELVADYTREAVAFLEAHRNDPFFLYLPHSAVHFPLYPSERFHGKSGHGLFNDWVMEVDWSVGEVLGTLRRLGLAEKTLVIFTSDNGGQPRHGAVNAPLRGGKGSTWEGGVRVPTIAWWPGTIPGGTESASITGMMDILPTFANLAGARLPADRKLDGADIQSVLLGTPGAAGPHEVFHYFRGLRLEAIRSGDWKLRLQQGELYHLGRDISESINVAQDHPDVVVRLRELARAMDGDLGQDGVGPGCRPLGKVASPQPILGMDGTPRKDAR